MCYSVNMKTKAVIIHVDQTYYRKIRVVLVHSKKQEEALFALFTEWKQDQIVDFEEFIEGHGFGLVDSVQFLNNP